MHDSGPPETLAMDLWGSSYRIFAHLHAYSGLSVLFLGVIHEVRLGDWFMRLPAQRAGVMSQDPCADCADCPFNPGAIHSFVDHGGHDYLCRI